MVLCEYHVMDRQVSDDEEEGEDEVQEDEEASGVSNMVTLSRY